MVINVREGVLLNRRSFTEAYILLHPDESYANAYRHTTPLYKTYLALAMWFSHSNLTYMSFTGQYSQNRYQEEGTEINPQTVSEFWLFIENFNGQAAALILTKDDENLTVNDYALLMYVSYLEDEDIKAMLTGFPVSVLREALLPAAQKNLESWLKG
jgi:hypothetical protein